MSEKESVAPDLGRGSSAPSVTDAEIDAWAAELGAAAAADEMTRALKIAREILAYDPNATHKKAVLARALLAQSRRSGPNTQMLEALKAARDHVWACWDNGDAEYADEIKADLDKIDAAINSAESERPEGAFLPDPPSKVG